MRAQKSETNDDFIGAAGGSNCLLTNRRGNPPALPKRFRRSSSRTDLPGASDEPVFRKALVAVAQELLKRKVTPKGAEEVLPKGSFKPKGGNNLKNWPNASERAAPPVQFMVTLQLFVAVIERSQSQLVEVKLKSGAYTVPDKEELNTFETDKPRRYATPNDCDRKCIVKIATDAVKEVAKEAGAANAKAIARAQ